MHATRPGHEPLRAQGVRPLSILRVRSRISTFIERQLRASAADAALFPEHRRSRLSALEGGWPTSVGGWSTSAPMGVVPVAQRRRGEESTAVRSPGLGVIDRPGRDRDEPSAAEEPDQDTAVTTSPRPGHAADRPIPIAPLSCPGVRGGQEIYPTPTHRARGRSTPAPNYAAATSMCIHPARPGDGGGKASPMRASSCHKLEAAGGDRGAYLMAEDIRSSARTPARCSWTGRMR